MTAPAGAGEAPPRPLARGTLSRQLVLRVTALVVVVAVLLSALTAVANYQILIQQLDSQLVSASGRFRDLDRIGQVPGPGSDQGGVGQPVGLVVYQRRSNGSVSQQTGMVIGTSGGQSLDADLIVQLSSLPATGQPVTMRLAGLGTYRVMVRTDPGGYGVNVVGLPMSRVTEPMAGQLAAAGLLTLVVIAAAFFVARRVVVRSLAPLNRLAATATEVSNLELERGEVEMTVRVPPEAADPVSEVGRVGLAFNHMLDNVEGALAARQASETKVRRFVADASHELRNPLASIRGYAELTRRERDDLSPTMSHAMTRIESESDRMSTLVEDLLLLARLDSGPDLDLKPTDLTEVVLNAVADARVAGADHHWSVSVPDQPVQVLGDRYRLHQVIANLLANARTHTPAGAHVAATVSLDGGAGVLTVTDDGPGIPDEIRHRVFERFTRADASRVRREGGSSTGLGLAIVAAVVTAHGGTARVDSVPGRTTFTVRLPLAG